MSTGISSRQRVLLVEDEAAIRELLRVHLSLAGFEIDESGDGKEALEKTREQRFDLIVLDLRLPSLDGITICRTIRAQTLNHDTPILMLTARDTESDKVLGLESGADDYLTKPFGMREFMARVSAVLRRSQVSEGDQRTHSDAISTRGLVLDANRREVTVRGRRVECTRQEFDVLSLLAARPGIVFSRAVVMSRVWGTETFVTERTVDRVVSRLRKKIERDPHDPELILTAWGVGYKFGDTP